MSSHIFSTVDSNLLEVKFADQLTSLILSSNSIIVIVIIVIIIIIIIIDNQMSIVVQLIHCLRCQTGT